LIATLFGKQTLAWRERRGYLSTPPAPLPPPATSNEAHDEQEQYGADGGVDDCTDQSAPEMDPELGQQPASDKGAQDSDDNVADDSESGPLHDLAGEPAGNEANKQYDQQAFARHVHLVTSRFAREGSITNWLAAVCIKLTSWLHHGR
jgi:hypothetical protein